MNDTIASFKNNIGLNSVTRGTLQLVHLTMPQYNDGRIRTIRIWVPEDYHPADTTKKYPVMYMHDGQNLFDTDTSFAGEWEIDESIGKMMDEGYEGAIIVGIDNSSDRLNELSPDWPRSSYGSPFITNPSGEQYASFIINTVKPYIDRNFNTNPSRITTGIGGSSMGGVISLYMALTYPHVFGYALLFSTALQLYANSITNAFITGKDFSNPESRPRLFIYAGGLEPSITPYVDIIRDTLVARGYPETSIKTLVDPAKGHNELAWAQHFPSAYSWLVSLK